MPRGESAIATDNARRSATAALAWLAGLAALTAAASAHPGPHHEIAAIDRILATQPARADAWARRGLLYRLEGNLPASVADLDRAVALAPADLDIRLHRALTLAELRRDADARDDLARYFGAGGDSANAFALRARLAERAGDTAAAIDDYAAALRRHVDVDRVLARGRLLVTAGRLDEAAACLRDALPALHQAWVVRTALIDIEARRGRHDAAIALVDEQISRLPNGADAWLRRATLLEQAGQPQAAAVDRRRALHAAEAALRARSTPLNRLALARALAAVDRPADARRELDVVLGEAPTLPAAVALRDELQSSTRGAR
ncbi:MAG: hypothetical protein U1A27_02825 [Phycisphaerae bacterium]